MGLFSKIKSFFSKDKEYQIVNTTTIDSKTTDVVLQDQYTQAYANIWQYIKAKENTQAEHVLTVITLDEWIDMDEIRKRIKDKFFIEYKHEKSLYPYIKTLVDIGLLETNAVGGKRKWKKKELMIKDMPMINRT
jgi:hypothetical protein